MADNKEQKIQKNKLYHNTTEIDLLELFREFWRHIIAILLCIIVFGGAAGAFSKFVVIPQYSSTAMMYIL